MTHAYQFQFEARLLSPSFYDQVPLYVVVFVPYTVVYGQLSRGILVASLIGMAEVLASAVLVLGFALGCFVRPLRRLTTALTRLRTLQFEVVTGASFLFWVFVIVTVNSAPHTEVEGHLAFGC